jgi:serine/threonine protein kinase
MSNAPAPTTAADSTQRGGDVLEAGVQIGDFRIERRIGAGGMGIVYQAWQVSLNRPVALKVLGQSLKRPGDLARFQREAQAAARLSHPGVASIYFIGQDRHICYLVMELVEGVSLRRVLDRLGQATAPHSGLDTAAREELAHQDLAKPLRFDQPTVEMTAVGEPAGSSKDALNPFLTPQAVELRSAQAHIRRSCEVIRDVASALAHAHERGVVHRDIKPDNILLDKSGKIHVIDFGVARFFDDLSVTYTGQLVGTPLYMSPEQVTGRGTIDPRTDVYSLGLVLYELLTLRPPLEPTNRENLLRTIITKALPPVSWRNNAVPEPLARIVHKATQKDPDQRYATAAELAGDLNCFLAGQSVAAPPYHFRLDEREIVAARPAGVVLSAFIAAATSFLVGMALLFFGLMMGVMVWQMGGNILLTVQALIAAAVVDRPGGGLGAAFRTDLGVVGGPGAFVAGLAGVRGRRRDVDRQRRDAGIVRLHRGDAAARERLGAGQGDAGQHAQRAADCLCDAAAGRVPAGRHVAGGLAGAEDGRVVSLRQGDPPRAPGTAGELGLSENVDSAQRSA